MVITLDIKDVNGKLYKNRVFVLKLDFGIVDCGSGCHRFESGYPPLVKS